MTAQEKYDQTICLMGFRPDQITDTLKAEIERKIAVFHTRTPQQLAREISTYLGIIV